MHTGMYATYAYGDVDAIYIRTCIDGIRTGV